MIKHTHFKNIIRTPYLNARTIRHAGIGEFHLNRHADQVKLIV